ncbi:CRISPR-associated helicase/endonuclease Cas3 [Thermus sp.]|uniref:CRISPR-associated helicase/endonuclease Cas3 n=1 Tax=Thermus sp. TaxID=275 RepID=UPI003D1372EC
MGALFAAWTARRRGLEGDALFLFLAVLEHHGSLSSPWERLPPGLAEGRRPKEGAWGVLPEQLKALDTGAFRALAASLGLPDPGPFLEGEAWEEAGRLALEADDLLNRDGQGLGDHFRLALLFSALLDADRRLAGQALPLAPRPIPPRAVEAHLAAKGPSGPLGPHREALFRGVARALEAPLERLFPARLTLTAPTGAGKSLAALRFALGLRERVREESGLLPKVVYALPYIAIADQVEEEARGILAKAGLDPETHLLVHHHLALARLREEEAVEEALALQETWDRDVVVTTFHQVFPALVGPGSGLRPLHALAEGAILILDEVQTLPAELWPLLRALLRELPGRVTVVSMTATQPRLVEGEEIAPPLPGYPARVRLLWGEARTLEDLAERLLREGPRGRLVVLNTVREAMDLYRRLKEGELPHLHLLTSHLIPKHRKGRLEAIRKALAGGVPLTLVATQVVEAGVDLDFQEGYRALAPLESLLQTAGRVNRNARGEGRLWVLDLEGESGKRVYGAVLLDRTRRVLEDRLEGGLEDREAYRLLPEYYRLVEEGISQARGQEALKALSALNYGRLEGFRFLEEAPSLPIFVEWDEEATRLLGRLEEALAQRDPKERRKALRLLLPRLQAYTVSPLLRRALKNLPPPLLGREDWRHVPREAVADFYDEEVGFLWEMEQFL